MKKNVLLVDDDQVAHFINRKLLEFSGLTEQIFTVSNGKEAIDHITHSYNNSSTLPDLIFIDVNMPIMNGFTFIETLRTLSFIPQEKIKIIVLSSSSHERDKERALQLGITHYISKPLSAQVIHTLF